jgi:hypothetical protein
MYVYDRHMPEISPNRTIGSRVSIMVSLVLAPTTGHRNGAVVVVVVVVVSAAKVTTGDAIATRTTNAKTRS